MTDPHFITAFIYLLATLVAWTMVIRTRNYGAEIANAAYRNVPVALLWLGLSCHIVALCLSLFGGDEIGMNIGFSNAVSLIIWLTLMTYVVFGRDIRLTRLALLYLAPIAILTSLFAVWVPAHRMVSYGAEWAFRLHFVVAILAYALFTVASLHALLMLFVEKRLHAGAVDHTSKSDFPPLLTVERLLFQLLTIAFVMLSATLVSGVVFSEELFGQAFQVTHKTVFALLSWFIFAGLLVGHWHFGVRGKIAVRWTLIGFALLLLSYVGSKFVLEIILKRTY